MRLIKKAFLDFFSKQFMIFLVIGGLAALVNFISRYLINKVIPFTYSVLLAYIIGMITAFLLQKTFTFLTGEKGLSRQFSYFIIINLFGMAQTFIISLALAEYLFPKYINIKYPYEISHLIGLAVPMFSSFLGHKYISFGDYNISALFKKIFLN